jgi:hypothetical protein
MMNVTRLLLAYDDFLQRVSERRRRPWVLGTSTYAVEHIRAVLDAVERHYVRRAAVGASSGPSETGDRERLRQFIQSLPPKPSASRVVVLGVLVILAAQALSALFGRFEQLYPEVRATSGAERSELLEALSDVASLSVSNVVKVVSVIIDAGLAGATVVLTIAGLAAWLVLRPLANGVAAAGALRDADTALCRLERAILTEAGVEPRTGSRLDLVVPALIAVPALLLALTLGREYFDGVQEIDLGFGVGETTTVEFIHPPILLPIALTLGVVAWARLTWLAHRHLPARRQLARNNPQVGRRRPGDPTSWRLLPPFLLPWVLVTTVFVGGLVWYGASDTTPTDVEIRLKTSIAEAVRDGAISLGVRSSERSEFDSVVLRGFSRLAPDDGDVDQEVLPFAVAMSTKKDVFLRLTAPQRRWLRAESQSGEAWLEVLLFDPAANETHLRVFLG